MNKIINKSEVPQYLQNGFFFATLPVHPKEISVPARYLKPDLSIETDQDLRHLLDSMGYWGVYQIPKEVSEYVENNISEKLLQILAPTLPTFTKRLRAAVEEITHDETLDLVKNLRMTKNFAKMAFELVGIALEPVCWSIVASLDDAASIPYLRTKGLAVDTLSFVQFAAKYGSMQCLEYAHSQGWEVSDQAMFEAVESGQLESVRFLHETCGKALTVKTMLQAAALDKLEVMRYLHEKGCSWDASVCAAASKAGHLSCLEYAHHHGCPWDESTFISAKTNTHENGNPCLDYAQKHRCPIPLKDDIIFKAHLSFACVVSVVALMRTLPVIARSQSGGCIKRNGTIICFVCEGPRVFGQCKYFTSAGKLPFSVFSIVYFSLFMYTLGCLYFGTLFLAGELHHFKRSWLAWLPEAMLIGSVAILFIPQYFWTSDPVV